MEAAQLIARIREAGEAGVDIIHVRERALAGGALARVVRRAVDVAGTARVVVNERMDVALAAGAAGVHLRGDSLSAARLRPAAPAGFLIGRSVHSADDARAVAGDGGVDVLTFGTVFPSRSKPEGLAPAGLGALARVVAAVPMPVIAIGGITPDRAAAVMATGAAGLAAIGMFDGADPLAPLVQALRAMV
jgi:thiamine-phosphate diphosphorylase